MLQFALAGIGQPAAVWVNALTVCFVGPGQGGTRIVFGKDHQIMVDASPEAVAKRLGEALRPR
jgi:hypothetical protein